MVLFLAPPRHGPEGCTLRIRTQSDSENLPTSFWCFLVNWMWLHWMFMFCAPDLHFVLGSSWQKHRKLRPHRRPHRFDCHQRQGARMRGFHKVQKREKMTMWFSREFRSTWKNPTCLWHPLMKRTGLTQKTGLGFVSVWLQKTVGGLEDTWHGNHKQRR